MYARSWRSGVAIARARSSWRSWRWFLTSMAVVMVRRRSGSMHGVPTRRPESTQLRAGESGAERGDLDDGRSDVRVARGDDLLAEVGHVGGVVGERRLEGGGALGLEELQVLADVGGGLGGHGARRFAVES